MKIFSIFVITLFVVAMSFLPVFAQQPDGPVMDDSCNDAIMNVNNASVANMIATRANTGLNYAGGSYGGDGGDGGDINNPSGNEVEDSTTGNGGTGGASSVGGAVQTGEAIAMTEVTNKINTNRTTINRCNCATSEEVDNDCDCSNDIVMNYSNAEAMNGVMTDANTGLNKAKGSYGGDAGDGGAIMNNGDEVDDSATGTGGNGAAGSEGGLVVTGISTSVTSVINVINRNITRINR